MLRQAKLFTQGDWMGYFHLPPGQTDMINKWRRVGAKSTVMYKGIYMLRIEFIDWLTPSHIITTDDSLFPYSDNSYKPLDVI